MQQTISRAEAKALGLKKYFTGKPCNRRGHLCCRLVSNTKCVECNKTDFLEWAKDKKDHLAAYSREYASRNKASVTKAKKEYKVRHRARVLEASKRYYVENKAVISEKSARHKQKNYAQVAERMRRYNRENRGRVTALAAKYRAAKLKATPAWADLDAIRRIYEDASAAGMEVDHVLPLQGRLVCGLHVEANLQIVPRSVNRRKSAKFDPDHHPA